MTGLALLSGYSSDDSDESQPKDVPSTFKPAARKVQIKIDSLPSQAEEPASARKVMPKPSGSKHSLFGMLPPPKRQDSEVRAERDQLAQQRKAAAYRAGDVDDDDEEAPSAPIQLVEQPQSNGVTKNNDSFRAMLGLKSSKAATKASQPAAELSSESIPKPKPVLPEVKPAPVTAPPNKKPYLKVSAAPEIAPSTEETPKEVAEDVYPGWELDPDGSWVPVTPEAQAQYQAYLDSASPTVLPQSQKRKRASDNLDGTRDLLSAGINPGDIQAFDASSAARTAYTTNTDADDTDKYAAAAEFAAGNRDATAPKPGHLRGLRRGQLSTLINMASENRSSLEQKWQRGREARSRAGNQYGF